MELMSMWLAAGNVLPAVMNWQLRVVVTQLVHGLRAQLEPCPGGLPALHPAAAPAHQAEHWHCGCDHVDMIGCNCGALVACLGRTVDAAGAMPSSTASSASRCCTNTPSNGVAWLFFRMLQGCGCNLAHGKGHSEAVL